MLVGGKSKVLPVYLCGHALALAFFWFVPPGGWLHAFWQMLSAWVSVAFMVLGVRRQRPRTALAWYLIGAGVFVNACGVVVDVIGSRLFGETAQPKAADAFWFALFPGVVAGLGILAYRRAAAEELGTMLLNTAICVLVNLFAGVLAWELIVWRTLSDPRLSHANRVVLIAYPLADLLVLALVLRFALGAGLRNVCVLLTLGWLVALLPSDIGWSSFLLAGHEPGRLAEYVMEGTWIISCALLSLASWHPDIHTVGPPAEGTAPRLGWFGWLGLLACAGTSALVVLLQAILDRLYSFTSL